MLNSQTNGKLEFLLKNIHNEKNLSEINKSTSLLQKEEFRVKLNPFLNQVF